MFFVMMAWAMAADCPDVTPVVVSSDFDGTRLVAHEAWFKALDDPKVVALAAAGYEPSLQAMGLTVGTQTRLYPVDGIAWHHVVNDRIGEVEVAVTF